MSSDDFKESRRHYFEKQFAKKEWLKGRKLLYTEQTYVPHERTNSRKNPHVFVKYLRAQKNDWHHGSGVEKLFSKKYYKPVTFWAERSRRCSYKQNTIHRKIARKTFWARKRQFLKFESKSLAFTIYQKNLVRIKYNS